MQSVENAQFESDPYTSILPCLGCMKASIGDLDVAAEKLPDGQYGRWSLRGSRRPAANGLYRRGFGRGLHWSSVEQ